ncbi:Flp1 family type IVb pilin [Cohnella nanjingensis]|uniref:Multidrug transporter n=1 Tax=Cohnella nanjingensis TaxID=1387779 RepID=A0A7X0RW92_9BACL|nr:Flp1 family type IVb pilin [Cohnella nanjingensis]MBB6674781.1 multidrug transporter [Cohnella nanjingensis]
MRALTRIQRMSVRWTAAFWRDKEGLGTLEIVLIAAVIIAVALLFREWILDFLGGLFEKVEGKSDSFFS